MQPTDLMKTILITGASRGIGLELSRQYYENGWRVIACVRNKQDTTKVNRLIGNVADKRLSILSTGCH